MDDRRQVHAGDASSAMMSALLPQIENHSTVSGHELAAPNTSVPPSIPVASPSQYSAPTGDPSSILLTNGSGSTISNCTLSGNARNRKQQTTFSVSPLLHSAVPPEASKTTLARSSSPSSTTLPSAIEHLLTDITMPVFRGKIHLLLVLSSPFWICSLLSHCYSWKSYVASAVASISGLLNFLASALLHNFYWSSSVRSIIQRIDHAGIFMMISGSTTPIPLLLLSHPVATTLLIFQWGATLYGIFSIIFGSLSRKDRRWERALVYIGIGLGHSLFLTEYVRVLTVTEFSLVVALALLYIIGAVIYARKKPNPFPRVFGFHEIFHFCCLVSAVCTFYLNTSVLRRAGGRIGFDMN